MTDALVKAGEIRVFSAQHLERGIDAVQTNIQCGAARDVLVALHKRAFDPVHGNPGLEPRMTA